jgi:plasmid maintenance system antidote protein VapI
MPKPKPVTPGELLREEYLIPMGMSQYRLAVGPTRGYQISKETT